MKAWKEIYEETKRPLSTRLSKTALKEIESEYQEIIEILKGFQPQNEAEEKEKEINEEEEKEKIKKIRSSRKMRLRSIGSKKQFIFMFGPNSF
jgi:hypothetical protein